MRPVPSATIHLSRMGETWRWRIADAEGRAVASGVAPGQMEAMAAAWRMAGPCGADFSLFPEIIIEAPDRAA
jgi:hypothetical protein